MINLSEIETFKTFKEASSQLEDKELRFDVDNRLINTDSVFIAIVGAKYNPLSHLDRVVTSGCKYIVYDQADSDLVSAYEDKLCFILVSDIEEFIQEAATHVARLFRAKNGQIIAISGSNGKTTTKEMLTFLLTEVVGEQKVISTQKNNNNHLGVPFTLFQIRPETEFAVVELGSNHPGEIEHLCQILNPQYGITTNIGDTHLEFFGDKENVFKEESVLYKYCSEKFYINEDDDFLKKIKKTKKRIGFGYMADDYTFYNLEGGIQVTEVELYNTHITGKHNFYNLAVAFLIATQLIKNSKTALKEAAKKFRPTQNRSQWIKNKHQDIFLDAYNANPTSMKVAIEGFLDHIAPIGAKKNEICFILGDMNELGKDSEKLHRDIAKFVSEKEVDLVIFVGRFAQIYAENYQGNHKCFEKVDILLEQMQQDLLKYKYLFIKGSRSVALEKILN
ncbi:MAG: UDP-N-acetylmuramoyl-tripeptide--D-alanyl-D-alanine ligase [Bacteriovoracaceae bacterium]|jgi:UDP-N-acetylmuramoyl-tripeptide--D-alanyl-D-alanine ligase|nr:UDP-N-acetylmuramoyl-tripeptide--D-alanyl-D-alanine ligase [Bacteriovoracaceae bacterium]